MQIKVHADYTTEEIGTPSLDVTLVAASSGAEAGVVNTADCHNDPWELPYTVGSGAGSTRTGGPSNKILLSVSCPISSSDHCLSALAQVLCSQRNFSCQMGLAFQVILLSVAETQRLPANMSARCGVSDPGPQCCHSHVTLMVCCMLHCRCPACDQEAHQLAVLWIQDRPGVPRNSEHLAWVQ